MRYAGHPCRWVPETDATGRKTGAQDCDIWEIGGSAIVDIPLTPTKHRDDARGESVTDAETLHPSSLIDL